MNLSFRIYSDGSLTFSYGPTSPYLPILTYSFLISRGKCHFHNYPEGIPFSKSRKGLNPTTTNYQGVLVEDLADQLGTGWDLYTF